MHEAGARKGTIDYAAGKDPQHEGRNDFFCDEGKGDGNEGWEQGIYANVNGFHKIFVSFLFT